MPVFLPPTVREAPADAGPLFGRIKRDIGVTVLKNAGVYTEHRYPTHEQVAGADVAYVGGHVYTVSNAEADALVAAGYAENIVYDPTLVTASTAGLLLTGQPPVVQVGPDAVSAVAATATLALSPQASSVTATNLVVAASASLQLVAHGAGVPPVVNTAALTLTALSAYVDTGYPSNYGGNSTAAAATYPSNYGATDTTSNATYPSNYGSDGSAATTYPNNYGG